MLVFLLYNVLLCSIGRVCSVQGIGSDGPCRSRLVDQGSCFFETPLFEEHFPHQTVAVLKHVKELHTLCFML